jgi:hypothetical protein
VRVLYVLSIRDAAFFEHLQTEPAHYDAWAHAIVAGAAPIHLPFDEAPGYPYFVALVYALPLGGGVLAVCLVQAALGAGACAAIAEVARRLGGPRAGWIAGALAAIYGPFIYFEDTNRYHNDETTPLKNVHPTCDMQGISPGWGDEYNWGIPGQWIRVPGRDRHAVEHRQWHAARDQLHRLVIADLRRR